MSKIDDFKSGAKSVAEPMAAKTREWVERLEIQNEINDNFQDQIEVVTEEVIRQNDQRQNVQLLMSFDAIEEDDDVRIIYQAFKKYYLDKNMSHSQTSLDFIKGINDAQREFITSATSIDVSDIKHTYEKEKSSKLLFTLVCICNHLVDSFDLDIFEHFKEELYISNKEMQALESDIQQMVRFTSIERIVAELISKPTDEAAVIDEEKDVVDRGASEHNDKDYTRLKTLITDSLGQFDLSFMQMTDEKEQVKILEYLNQFQLDLVDETIIAFLNYKKIYLKEKMDILFTTHALYVSVNKKIHQLTYVDLINKGRSIIDENISMSKDQSTTFSLTMSDGHVIDFNADKFNNDGLLSFLTRLINTLDHTMVAERDTVIAIADMTETIKGYYLKVISRLLQITGLGTSELFRLAYDLKASPETITLVVDDINNSHYSIDDLLKALVMETPYPSTKYLGYALVKDCYKMLYLTKGHDPDSFKVKIEEASFLNQIMEVMAINPESFEDLDASLLEVKLAFNQLSKKDYDNIVKRLKASMQVLGGPLVVLACSSLAANGFASALALTSLSGSAGFAAIASLGLVIPGAGQILALSVLGSAALKKTVIDKYAFLKQRKELTQTYLDSYERVIKQVAIDKIESSEQYLSYYRRKKSMLFKELEAIIRLEREYKNVPIAGDLLDKVEVFTRNGFGKRKK